MLLAALLACTDAADTITPPVQQAADLVDPLPLAAQVDEAELAATIDDLAALGTRYTGTQANADAQAYLSGRLEDVGLVPETTAFDFRGGIGANVVARKEGAERPEVVWIFSAHYDSTSESPEESAPGADDNASAVAAVLEAARLLAPARLRDSVWFVLTGAEEQGARGARALVDALDAEGTDVQGVIAPDMIGYWPLGEGDALDILGDDESADLATSMEAVADELGVANKLWIDHTYCYGDDHTWFQEAGYPAISPMDCVESHNGLADEDLPHYHRSTDTPDTLHLPFTARVTEVLVVTLAGWAGPIALP